MSDESTGKSTGKRGRKENLVAPWRKGQSGNPNGYMKGVKNRSTIAKKILAMKGILPSQVFDKLKVVFPEIEERMTVEEIMTIVMAGKAITKADHNAYIVIMDSGYGKPKESVDIKNENKWDGAPRDVLEKEAKLRGYVKK